MLGRHPNKTIADELADKFSSKDVKHIHVKEKLPNWVPREGPKGGLFLYDRDHKMIYLSQMSEKQKQDFLEKDPSLKPLFDRVQVRTTTFFPLMHGLVGDQCLNCAVGVCAEKGAA